MPVSEAGTAEVTFLEGIDPDGTPPCTAVWILAGIITDCCARPSVVRVRTRCLCCDANATQFFCRECWADLQDGHVVCARCGAAVTDYRET